MWTLYLYGPLCVYRDTNFFFVLEKITILLFERNKPIIKILLKDFSKRYNCGSLVKVNALVTAHSGISCEAMSLVFTIPRRNYHQYA